MVLGFGFLITTPAFAFGDYEPIAPNALEGEIEEFFGKGAVGYLMWQYSGDAPGRGTFFANDQYSWFRNGDTIDNQICSTLSRMGAKYNSEPIGVGVNVWSLGDQSPGVINEHLNYLKNECGVKTIRVFAYAGGVGGLQNVLNAADAVGVQVIAAIGDYSNGGGGIPKGAQADWYAGGYASQAVDGIVYQSFAQQIAAAAAGHSSLYALELGNEPHCGGDPGAVGAYNSWAANVSNLLRGAGIPNVGIGQMASQQGSVCDTVIQGNFTASNNASGISVNSGHYYNAEEKELVLQALAQGPKLFYIGEAGWGGAVATTVDDYYLYPIDGLAQGGTDQIASSLVNQGYQVHCTTPKITVLAQQGGLFDLVPPGEVTVGVDASQNYDYTDAKFPLLRSILNNGLMNSLENFWGFRDTSSENQKEKQVNSAPIYSLLSLKQQCEQQIKQLESVEALCNKLEDPATCALYESVPDTSYDTKTLLEAYRNSGSSCGTFYGGTPKSLTEEQQQIKDGLANVSLYLNKAYRLAFLVVTAETKGQLDAPNAFNFLGKDPETGEARPGEQAPHEVRVIAFKVPDVATNKDPNDPGFYDDALSLTKNVLVPEAEIKKQKNDESQRRVDFLDATLNPGQTDLLIPPINCGGNCGQPLSQALVNMINANRISCQAGPQDLRYEPSDDIGTPTDVSSSEGRTFTEPEGDIVQALEERQQTGPDTSFDFLGQVTLNTQGDGQSQLVSYLVYPAGAEIESIEDTLAGYLYTDAGVKSFKANPDIPKYFKFNDVIQEFDTTKPQVGVNAPEDHPCRQQPANIPTSPDDPLTNRQPCTAEAYLEANQGDSAPRVLGGWLGSLTRGIQKSLHNIGTTFHDYIASCTTTEDFLLGKCSGESSTGSAGSGTKLSGEGEYCIDWELANSSINVEALKQNVRSYLTSLPYTFNQPGSPSRPGNVYQEERYQELLEQTHRDWNGNIIPPEVINEFENYYGGGRALLWTISPECNNQVCFDYVMDYCEAKGYNPALCVAMNLSETGGSNHVRFSNSYDFGCLAAQAKNVTSGLECLTDRFFSRDAVAGLDYNGMWKIYAEHGFDSPSYNKVRQYYTDLSGGIGLTAGACK